MNDLDRDENLVREARAAHRGDMRAFDELVERHQGRVMANCRHLTGSPEDAQDLAQEVFVKAFFAMPRFEGRAKFGTWIQRIKVNHCLNFLRKRRGVDFVDVDDPQVETHERMAAAPEVEGALEARDRKRRIRAVLDTLPDTLRVPLVMRDLDGMAYQEIADEMGVSLSAVKMRIKRGREEFRRVFAGGTEPETAGAAEGGARDG